jgi:hypothetical protein
MNQIVALIGLIIVVLIAFKLMATLASFVMRIGLLLALAIAGYVWWQYMRH